MRRHVADGDRHAALRQFERLTAPCAGSSACGPGARPWRCVTASSTELSAPPAAPPGAARPRPRARRRRRGRCARSGPAATGRCSSSGAAGMGKSALVAAAAARAAELGLRTGSGTAAAIEGAWPFAPVRRGARRPLPAASAAAGRPARRAPPRAGAGARGRRGGLDRRRRAPAAVPRRRRAGPPGRGGRGRRARPSTTCTKPTTRPSGCCTTSPARPRGGRVGLVLAARPAPASDDADRAAPQPARAARRRRARARPARRRRRRRARARARRPTRPRRRSNRSPRSAGASRSWSPSSPVAPRRGTPLDDGVLGGVPGRPARSSQGWPSPAPSSTPTSSSRSPTCPRTRRTSTSTVRSPALVVEPTDVGYRFRHALVREALLAGLTAHRRRRIHRDAAERLSRSARSRRGSGTTCSPRARANGPCRTC